MKFRVKLLSFLLTALFFTGCATVPTFRSHPQLNDKVGKIKKVIVMPPKIDVYQLTAGGVKEKMDEWTSDAKKNVIAAIENEFKDNSGCVFQCFSEDTLPKQAGSNFEDTMALFEAVNASIVTHTYGPPEQLFSEKIKDFDYSLGPEIQGLAEPADFILLVRGIDHISTEGRKALQVGAILLGALVGVVVVPQSGVTAVSMALVNVHNGSILWYNFKGSAGAYDLRDEKSATTLVKELLKDFPIK